MKVFKNMEKNRLYILTLLLLASPFYLNDFSSIYVTNWQWWLFIDYMGVKVFPCLVTLWLLHSKKMRAKEFGLTTQSIPLFFIAFLAVSLIGIIIDQNGYNLIAKLPGYSKLGAMPEITSPFWNWMDLTFGLLMVGICEELVFRGYMYTFINRYTQSSFIIVVISSIAFGLIHWSLGLQIVVVTSVIGAVFMIAYIITRSLPAIMLAHFAVNFVDYAGVIPKSIFSFY